MNFIVTQREQGVLTLTINRPAQKNAINVDMYLQLAKELEQTNNDNSINSVLLTANGDTFTAGNDLQDFLNPPSDERLPAVEFLMAIVNCAKPIVAAVNGPAIGIGLTVLLHCDLVIAAESATFTAPFTKLGLVPEAASSLLLPEVVGQAMANDILLAGRALNSTEAMNCGLISRIVADTNIVDAGFDLAKQLACLPANAMLKSKALIKDKRRQYIIEKINEELQHFSQQLRSEEFKTAVQPLLSKRN